mmetsp:Transcript_18392/g.46154  ORF Transcript_18392/g.46154 Transcript_18392/m.46154 type:complete len:82 (+) Transcript_18392:1744-1989(+)
MVSFEYRSWGWLPVVLRASVPTFPTFLRHICFWRGKKLTMGIPRRQKLSWTHAGGASGAKFLNDSHFVSVGSDACVKVWKF